MPFEKILQSILAIEGAESVIFLDQEGEMILSSGNLEEEKLRLTGAYQSILLGALTRMGIRSSRTIITIYQERFVLTHHLKDGYFISVIFNNFANWAKAQFLLTESYSRLKAEL